MHAQQLFARNLGGIDRLEEIPEPVFDEFILDR